MIALLLGTLAVARFNESQGPAAVVRGYFAALGQGNAPAALAFAQTRPSGEYLTSEVLDQQRAIARISDVQVGRVDRHGSSASVAVHYRLGFSAGSRRVDDSAELVKAGSSWRMTQVASRVQLAVPGTGADRLTMAARPLPSGRADLFPGPIPVAVEPAALVVADQPLIRLTDNDSVTSLKVAVSPAARQRFDQSVQDALDRCLRGAPADPLCPQPDAGRVIPATLRGTASVSSSQRGAESIQIKDDPSGWLQLDEQVTVKGSWQEWDFNNQAVPRKGTVVVSLHVLVLATDLTTIHWTTQ